MSKNIALVVGSGNLPKIIFDEIRKLFPKSIITVICVDDGSGWSDFEHFKSSFSILHNVKLTDLNKMKSILKATSPVDVLIAGKVKKPNFDMEVKNLKQSFFSKAFSSISKIGKKVMGDDAILKFAIKYVQTKGVKVRSVKDLLPSLMAVSSDSVNINKIKVEKVSINKGFDVLKFLSKVDLSQSLVIQDRCILGVEGVEGTDELIKRCSFFSFASTMSGPILVKRAKKNQTFKADIPVIGPETAENIIRYNYAGIALKQNEVMILDKDKVIKKLEQAGKFLYIF